MKKVHVLKTVNPYFDDEKKGCFLNRTLDCKINYILGLNFLEGLELNYVVLGLKDFHFTMT